VRTFDDVMNHLLPGIIESGHVERAACRAACPRDAELLQAIVLSAEPEDRLEQQVLGHLTALAAELLAETGQPLVMRRAPDYVGYQLDAPRALIRMACRAGAFVGAFMSAGTIVCEGSCGDFAFQGASGGLGIVKGNAGEFCAEEIHGTASVRVLGSVGNSAGRCMRGGELVVCGDAGRFFCRYMRGGLARVRDVELLGETYGGTIRARRILALEKGRRGTHRARLILGPGDEGGRQRP